MKNKILILIIILSISVSSMSIPTVDAIIDIDVNKKIDDTVMNWDNNYMDIEAYYIFGKITDLTIEDNHKKIRFNADHVYINGFHPGGGWGGGYIYAKWINSSIVKLEFIHRLFFFGIIRDNFICGMYTPRLILDWYILFIVIPFNNIYMYIINNFVDPSTIN